MGTIYILRAPVIIMWEQDQYVVLKGLIFWE